MSKLNSEIADIQTPSFNQRTMAAYRHSTAETQLNSTKFRLQTEYNQYNTDYHVILDNKILIFVTSKGRRQIMPFMQHWNDGAHSMPLPILPDSMTLF